MCYRLVFNTEIALSLLLHDFKLRVMWTIPDVFKCVSRCI